MHAGAVAPLLILLREADQLPKKIAGVDPLLGDYYTAADTRPLVIVNTDNRLLASAMRVRMEPKVMRQKRALKTSGWLLRVRKKLRHY